jgi:hypothetical protein
VIADIDDDDEPEIAVGTSGGYIYIWNVDGTGYLDSTGIFASPGAIYGSLAVGDLDNNGDLEIVCPVQFANRIMAYDHDGTEHTGWPALMDCDVYISPALTELDGDGLLDVIGASFRGSQDDTASVYVLTHRGNNRPGWPKGFESDFFGSPVAGDISGDGEPDIIIAGTDGNVYAWHADGSPVLGWPRHFRYAFNSAPMLGDLDNDGDVEVVVGGYDAFVHIFDVGVPYDEESMHWPRLCHDLYNSGLYGGPSQSGVNPDLGGDIPAKLVLSGYPNPAKASVNIRLGIPSSAAAGEVEVELYDVRGRLVKQVYNGRLDPGFHEFRWDGTDQAGHSVSSGIYFMKANSGSGSAGGKVVLVR